MITQRWRPTFTAVSQAAQMVYHAYADVGLAVTDTQIADKQHNSKQKVLRELPTILVLLFFFYNIPAFQDRYNSPVTKFASHTRHFIRDIVVIFGPQACNIRNNMAYVHDTLMRV
jgi:hypothetical protein